MATASPPAAELDCAMARLSLGRDDERAASPTAGAPAAVPVSVSADDDEPLQAFKSSRKPRRIVESDDEESAPQRAVPIASAGVPSELHRAADDSGPIEQDAAFAAALEDAVSDSPVPQPQPLRRTHRILESPSATPAGDSQSDHDSGSSSDDEADSCAEHDDAVDRPARGMLSLLDDEAAEASDAESKSEAEAHESVSPAVRRRASSASSAGSSSGRGSESSADEEAAAESDDSAEEDASSNASDSSSDSGSEDDSASASSAGEHDKENASPAAPRAVKLPTPAAAATPISARRPTPPHAAASVAEQNDEVDDMAEQLEAVALTIQEAGGCESSDDGGWALAPSCRAPSNALHWRRRLWHHVVGEEARLRPERQPR